MPDTPNASLIIDAARLKSDHPMAYADAFAAATAIARGATLWTGDPELLPGRRTVAVARSPMTHHHAGDLDDASRSNEHAEVTGAATFTRMDQSTAAQWAVIGRETIKAQPRG